MNCVLQARAINLCIEGDVASQGILKRFLEAA